MLFGNSSSIQTKDLYWPDTVQTFYLWQVYIDNVHPLTNWLRLPTIQRLVLEATGPMDVDMSAQSKALLSAVFLAAVESLDDAECTRLMADSRHSLLKKLLVTTQHNLLKADLRIKPGQVVLQTFVLYLLAARQHSSLHSSWLVIGIAVRCAQRLDAHRAREPSKVCL